MANPFFESKHMYGRASADGPRRAHDPLTEGPAAVSEFGRRVAELEASLSEARRGPLALPGNPLNWHLRQAETVLASAKEALKAGPERSIEATGSSFAVHALAVRHSIETLKSDSR